MRRAHLIVGILGVLAFLASGQYMDVRYDHLRGMDDAVRMIFRSTHIYVLLAAGLNLVLGLYLTRPAATWRRMTRHAGSIAILASPAFFLAGFLTEPFLSDLARPWSTPGIYAAFGGFLLHALSRIGSGIVEPSA